MKKLMFGLAALAAGSVMAIESANIVGYTTISTPQATFQLGTVPFEAVGGSLELNKILSGFTPVEIDWEGDPTTYQKTAAQLQIWNPAIGNYDMAWYVSNAWYDNGTEDGALAEGWCDGDGLLLDGYEFVPGVGYWVKNVPDSKSLNASGQVSAVDAVEYECPAAFSLAGNVFPIATALNGSDMTCTGITPVEIDWEGDPTTYQKTAAQLQIWNPAIGNYDMAWYVSNAWFDNGTEDGALAEGWCDGDGLLRSDYKIGLGCGFWVKATSGAFTIKFNNPIK